MLSIKYALVENDSIESIKEVTTMEIERPPLLLSRKEGDQMLHNEMYWKTSRKLEITKGTKGTRWSLSHQ